MASALRLGFRGRVMQCVAMQLGRQLSSFKLTRGGDKSNLGADCSLSPFTEGAYLNDIRASFWQCEHGGRVNGPCDLVVAFALLSE